jgi:predicted enzyme related to lactoylglutathione lyase
MNLSLNSIILFVNNVDILKDFYIKFLNLKLSEEIKSEWVLLNAGNCTIGLHKIGDQYQNSIDNQTETNTKIVFETTDDISVIRNSLQESGAAIREISKFENYDFIFFDGEDPEGNVFQIRQIQSK